MGAPRKTQLFQVGERVIEFATRRAGTVMAVNSTGQRYDVWLEIGDYSVVKSLTNEELMHEPLPFELRPGNGIITTRGDRGYVRSVISFGEYVFPQMANEPQRPVGALVSFDGEAAPRPVFNGHFRKETFGEWLWLHPGKFGHHTKRQALVRFAAFIAFAFVGLRTAQHYEQPAWGFGLVAFCLLAMAVMCYGYWRNFKGLRL